MLQLKKATVFFDRSVQDSSEFFSEECWKNALARAGSVATLVSNVGFLQTGLLREESEASSIYGLDEGSGIRDLILDHFDSASRIECLVTAQTADLLRIRITFYGQGNSVLTTFRAHVCVNGYPYAIFFSER